MNEWLNGEGWGNNGSCCLVFYFVCVGGGEGIHGFALGKVSLRSLRYPNANIELPVKYGSLELPGHIRR